jgi:hypothetical protein
MSSLTKGQKRLLVVLAIVVAYGIFDVISNKDSYFGYYGGNKKEKKIKPANVVDVNIPEIKKVSNRNAKYLRTWGDDPFYNQRFVRRKISHVPVQTKVQLNLKAISYGENSVVMINDRVLMVGDVIEGYQIKKIEPGRVLLSKGSENKTLILK